MIRIAKKRKREEFTDSDDDTDNNNNDKRKQKKTKFNENGIRLTSKNEIDKRFKPKKSAKKYDCPLGTCAARNLTYTEIKTHSYKHQCSPKHLKYYVSCYWCNKIYLERDGKYILYLTIF